MYLKEEFVRTVRIIEEKVKDLKNRINTGNIYPTI
jgi:hypothetical protein